MNNKFKILLSNFLCAVIIFSMALPFGSAVAEEGKQGTFFAYLFSESTQTDNMLKPYDLVWSDLTSKGVTAVAKETAFYLKSMPEGRHAIDIHRVMYEIMDGKENVVWWDKGTEKVREMLLKYFEALKNEGAELDYIIDDMEGDMTNWSIRTDEVADSITGDPRYETDIKPVLAERNFKFGDETQGDLYYVVNYRKDASAYNIWNRLMDGDRLADYHNRAAYEPASMYYPDVKLSNYGSSAYNGTAPVISGSAHKSYLGGPGKNIGTHSSPVCYGSLVHLSYVGNAPDGYPYEQFMKTGYNAMLMDILKSQSAYLSTEGKIMPWIGLKNWSSDSLYGNFFSTDYYNEFVLHMGLLNPDPFLIYNTGSSTLGDDEALIKNLLYQLDELCGFDDRKPILDKVVSWDSRYVLSGMYAGGRNVWRITPDLYTPGISIENFLIDNERLTFQIGNQVVIFPEGSYIYEAKENLSDYGYWVISPKGTYPEELRIDSIPIPEQAVATEDFIPTGYTMERNFETYNPVIHSIEKNDTDEKTNTSSEDENKKDEPAVPAHWAQKELDAAVKAGILVGTGNGLMPDRNITRAEFVTMLLRAMHIEFSEKEGSNWYDGPINVAREYGWIEPDDDGVTILSREETARIMVRAFNISATSRSISFADIGEVSSDMKDAVLDAASMGMINGYPDGTFRPKGNITRAEAVTIIIRCIN